MAKQYYFPRTEAEWVAFLQNLVAKMGTYTVPLGITGGDLSFCTLSRDLCMLLLDYQNRAENFADEWFALKRAVLLGPAGEPTPFWPVWTGAGTAPTGLTSGVFVQLRAIIARWKDAPGYTEAIGEDLGIVGSDEELDTENAQPELKISSVAGEPKISAQRNGFEAVEVEVDRGQGWQMLNVITGRSTVDNAPLPPSGQSAVRKYRGIYRKNNERVGNFSPVQTVAVVGI